jgi:murein DD-endopeptidase MepM/ murein hydrolase activator NlpD
VVPSALRTLSVVTLLSAVSGTVFLVSDHGVESATAINATTDSASLFGGGSGQLAAAAAADLRSIPTQRQPVASIQDQRQAAASEQLALREEAAAQARALAKAAAAEAKAKAAEANARAKARAEAAAERRRKQAQERASRSAQRNPKAIARLMAADRGWGAGQFSCLSLLWTRESGWNYRAMNPSSGAYGIPQSLPGSKMASAGSDWRTNPVTQITWGLDYIADRYGTPCGAWAHSESSGWY